MKSKNQPDDKKRNQTRLKSKVETRQAKKKSLEYAFWLLGRRAYTQKQIREKLESKEFGSQDIESTVERLINLKFLDDFEFAKNYVRQSTLGKPKGKYRLKIELSRKGVDKELIEQALTEELSGEEDLASQALARYGKKFAKLDRQKRYEKSMRFLLGRGFSYDVAKKAVATQSSNVKAQN